MKKSEVTFTKEIPIYWGDYSQIEAELELFETAQRYGEYSMYHLLSGVDLPLDTAENIYNFFDEHKENNFLTPTSDEIFEKNKIYDIVKYYYVKPKLMTRNIKNKYIRKAVSGYRKLEFFAQKKLNIDVFKKYKMDLKYGSNWCSLNTKAVKVILEEKEFIEKVFINAKINDELFVPTILNKQNLLNTLYYDKPINDLPDDFQGNLRYINWWDGSPHTWTTSERDIEQLKYGKAQGHLFSRKFDLEVYPEMKEKILEIINS